MSKMLDYSRKKAEIGIKLLCTESSNKIGLVKAHYSPTHWVPPFEHSPNHTLIQRCHEFIPEKERGVWNPRAYSSKRR